MTLAERAAADLLRRHRQDHGDWPRAIVLNVWGTAAMRTGGEDIALALLLLGVRPVWDEASGRVNGFTVTPIAELDRPRVDVTLRISGLFRDAFAAQVTLFDAAAAAVAARDEAADWNPLAGRPGPRVFGPALGQYGAGTDWLAASQPASARRRRRPTRRRWPRGCARPTPWSTCRTMPRPTCWTVRSTPPISAASPPRRPRSARRRRCTTTTAAPAAWPSRSRRVVRGRAANPAWLAGMMRHGYAGGAEMARAVDALAAFAAHPAGPASTASSTCCTTRRWATRRWTASCGARTRTRTPPSRPLRRDARGRAVAPAAQRVAA